LESEEQSITKLDKEQGKKVGARKTDFGLYRVKG